MKGSAGISPGCFGIRAYAALTIALFWNLSMATPIRFRRTVLIHLPELRYGPTVPRRYSLRDSLRATSQFLKAVVSNSNISVSDAPQHFDPGKYRKYCPC